MTKKRVVDPWFARSDLGNGVSWLTEPEVDPLLRSNIWHVRGRDFDLMIDAGLGVSSLRRAAPDLFRGNVKLFATHTHYDHIGGHMEFSEAYCHAFEKDDLVNAGSIEFSGLRRKDIPEDIVAMIENSGYPIPDELLTALPCADFNMEKYKLNDFRGKVNVVGEGDVIDLGDRAFEVLHIPGHSPGSIGLLEHNTGVFFSGDAIYDGPLIDNIPGANREEYIATLERLLSLRVSIVHGGHETSFGSARMIEIIQENLRAWGS